MRKLMTCLALAVPALAFAAAVTETPAAPAAAPEAPVAAAPAAPAPEAPAVAPSKPSGLMPPAPPVREKQELSSASMVVLDMAKSIAFMEQGQVYYKAYAKGTHTSEENKAFVRFVEDYERELMTVKKEFEVIKLWTEQKSTLKPD
jgi:hypothetical protein